MPTPNPLPNLSNCSGCGVCCLHMGYPEYVRDKDGQPIEEYWTSMPATLKAELLAFMEAYPAVPEGELHGPCCWFDPLTRQCRNHEYRPRVCRDFPIGGSGCLAWRDIYREQIVG